MLFYSVQFLTHFKKLLWEYSFSDTIDPDSYINNTLKEYTMYIDSEEVLRKKLIALNVLCLNEGKSSEPHYVGEDNGMHMSGTFFGEYIWGDPDTFTNLTIRCIMSLNNNAHVPFHMIDKVVGVGGDACVLAYKIAEQIMKWNDRQKPCFASFCEEKILIAQPLTGAGKDPIRESVMDFPIHTILRGERILLVTNSIVSGFRIQLAIDAVQKAGGLLIPQLPILVLANLSPKKEIEGLPVHAMVNYPLERTPREVCPLCNLGSPALKRDEFRKAWQALRGVT